MKNIKKINKLSMYLLVTTVVLSIFSFTYAYFTANVEGAEETTTITTTGGTMNIVYNGGANINLTDIYPKEESWETKTFTVTGNNTTGQDMFYNISLNIVSNTFSSGTLKYKLNSTNTDGNGTIIPTTIIMEDIPTSTNEIFLGNGSFIGVTSGNKVHTYSLEIYFPDTGLPQNENQGKQINAYVKTEEGIKPLPLRNMILDLYGSETNITTASIATFSNINSGTDNLMYSMLDDYGTSYYYRGAKNYVNNNLIFADHQWKIVRINGDGSIRIIYNGKCPNNSCAINATGTSTQMGTSAFNSSYNDNKYVGYMFGGLDGTASTSRAQAIANETNSTIKTFLDNWYINNIQGKEYENNITDTLFCNDRQLQSGTGIGRIVSYYATNNRLHTKKEPTLKCGVKNDRFTVTETTVGNGALTYPIGLLTADEIAIAGLKFDSTNSTNYLYTNQFWWTLSPNLLYGGWAYSWHVDPTGKLYTNTGVYLVYGVRGVLNLKPDTQVLGTGTISDPYKVINI